MAGRVRVLRPDRGQLEWRMIDLEGLLPSDHRARIVWSFVEGLDLSGFYGEVRSRVSGPGRPASDPAVLLSLWLFATLEGVGSARRLALLCERDAAYMWLCGGVPVNYHGLSAFRSGHGALLDDLLSEQVAALAASGAVSLEEVAIDGTKVRASAGAGSFRGVRGLRRWEAAARSRIAALKRELESDPGAGERRRCAAQARAERELGDKVAAARLQLAALRKEKAARSRTHKKDEAEKKKRGKGPKASSTDADARAMRFADGGLGAGYNLQFAVCTDSHAIVGVQETGRRNDQGLMRPMVEQLEGRYGCRPARVLVDTRYACKADIEWFGASGAVYMPPAAVKETAKPNSIYRRAARLRREPAALQAWRARMESAAGKAVYRRRQRIEAVNGNLKHRGLGRLTVRGFAKVRAVALLHALAHNLWRAHRLAVG